MCRYGYGIEERYKLFTTLASTVLQLCATPWFHTVWSKNDMYLSKVERRSGQTNSTFRNPEGFLKDLFNRHCLPDCVLGVILHSLLMQSCLSNSTLVGRSNQSPSIVRTWAVGNPLPYGQTEDKKLNQMISRVDAGTREEAAYFQAIKRYLWCDFDSHSLDLKSSQFQEVLSINSLSFLLPMELVSLPLLLRR
jgi:hypothetical protein